MLNVRYHAKRFVPASRDAGGAKTELICMVQIELPDGGITSLAIPEAKIAAQCGRNPIAEEMMIQNEVRAVVASMLAGAGSDLAFEAKN